MHVFMDDNRIGPFNEFYGHDDSYQDWVIVRGVKNVKGLLQAGMVDDLSLDHDMGRQDDGSDLVNWMIANEVFPKGNIYVHSANGIGAERMIGKLKQYFEHFGIDKKVFQGAP